MKPSTQPSVPSVDLPDDVVLSARGVSKKFCRNLRRSMWYGLQDLGRNSLGLRTQDGLEVVDPASGGDAQSANSQSPLLRRDEFWAVKDISLELRKGESLGIVGVNGCGKSTLLRILCGIYPPDQGAILSRGRIGALIALGAGFHPHLSGRENVFLNASILGIPAKEIKKQFDNIVDFAEIGDFIASPVSTYSSGMKVRLGYAVAAFCFPDIMLIDEVLAVGDINFKRKCMSHLRKYLHDGGSLIFVSHSMDQVEAVCDRVLLLDHGVPQFLGEASEGVAVYYEKLMKARAKERKKGGHYHDKQETDEGNLRIIQMRAEPVNSDRIIPGSDVRFFVDYEAKEPVDNVWFGLNVVTSDQAVRITTVSCRDRKPTHAYNLAAGRGSLSFVARRMSLSPGTYCLKGGISCAETKSAIAVHGWDGSRPSFFEVGIPVRSQLSRTVVWDEIIVFDVTWED
jgi:lipopolysaccharide transport system ATP-binding protein